MEFLDLSPETAIEFLVSRHSARLREDWDAASIAFIAANQEGSYATYVPRDEATRELRRFADAGAPHDDALRAIAARIAAGQRAGCVECVILAGDIVVMVMLDLERLRSLVPLAIPVEPAALAAAIDECLTLEGALRAVGAVRVRLLAENGRHVPAVEALERALVAEWSNCLALAAATRTARDATDVEIDTGAGRHARFVLTMLGEAIRVRQRRTEAPSEDA